MTEPEDQRPESTEEAAEIVTHDPALNVATDQNESESSSSSDEEVSEPTD